MNENVTIHGISAKYVPELSWEHAHWYWLENDCLISVAWSQHYGDWISVVADSEGIWQANCGLKTLPERFNWILSWLKPVAGKDLWDKLLYPDIVKKS